MHIGASTSNDPTLDQIKGITTLYSGKTVDNKVQKPPFEPNTINIPVRVEVKLENGDTLLLNVEELEEDLPKVPDCFNHEAVNTTPPFPQRLKTKVENSKASEFLELLSNVQIIFLSWMQSSKSQPMANSSRIFAQCEKECIHSHTCEFRYH